MLSIFTDRGCASSTCHGGTQGGGGGLSGLDDFDLGYDELLIEGVGCAVSSLSARVAPGDPDASFLVGKISGTQDCGSPMPLFGEMLSADEVMMIRDWITAGAPKN